MEYALFGVIGVVVVVGAAAFSRRLGVAAPLLLVLIGIVYSYVPGTPSIDVPSSWILMGVLPPLLYSAAITVPVVDFRRNLASISALSVGLVVVSALVTGFALYMVLERLNLAAAIALGAVISPTDVVAATSIARRMGLPARLVTILEGEGLVNDATALVLLRSAIAAAALTSGGGDFNVWSAVGDFVYAAAVAVAIGFVIGIVSVGVRGKLRDPLLDTAVSFAVPFLAYIPAEEIHASGVLAVVVAGLYSGHHAAARFSAQSRIAERINWRTAQFVLENGVFLLMGVQLKHIVDDVPGGEVTAMQSVLLGLMCVGILIVLRILFVGPLIVVLRRTEKLAEGRHSRVRRLLGRLRSVTMPSERAQRRQARIERMQDRRSNDIAQLKAEGLGWRGGSVLAWAGMRGVVTLAAAQSLPRNDTPYYEQLVLVAFTVAIATLLLQGGTLPLIIRISGIRGSDRVADRRQLATLLDEMSEAGLQALENPEFSLPGDQPVDDQVIERVRRDTMLAAQAAWERAENAGNADGIVDSPHQQYRALRREVLQAEREALLEARARGAYPSRILQRAQSMLDLEEARLEQIDTGGRVEV